MKAWKSKTTTVQTLLFPRGYWTRSSAASWAKKHGFRASKPDVTDDYIRLRQENPEIYQRGTFRTITLGMFSKKPIRAVIGRPWIVYGNPRCVLFDTIHKDWRLHRRKHDLYARLAKQKGAGKYSAEKARRAFRLLALEAARLYRRQQKIKPAVKILFPPDRLNRAIDKLQKEFVEYWRKGRLDQYLPRSAWSKRQEK